MSQSTTLTSLGIFSRPSFTGVEMLQSKQKKSGAEKQVGEDLGKNISLCIFNSPSSRNRRRAEQTTGGGGGQGVGWRGGVGRWGRRGGRHWVIHRWRVKSSQWIRKQAKWGRARKRASTMRVRDTGLISKRSNLSTDWLVGQPYFSALAAEDTW